MTSNPADFTFADLSQFAQSAGIVGLVLTALWTGKKGIWVWASSRDEAVLEVEKRILVEAERRKSAEERTKVAEDRLDVVMAKNEDRGERVALALSESSRSNIEAAAKIERLTLEVATLKGSRSR